MQRGRLEITICSKNNRSLQSRYQDIKNAKKDRKAVYSGFPVLFLYNSRHALYVDPGIGGLHGFQAGLADGNDVNGLTVRNRNLTRFKKRNQRL